LKKLTTLCILLVTAFVVHAQESFTQYQYWLRYQNQLTFSPTWHWINEIDNRRFIAPDVEAQLIVHSHLHYKKGRWDFAPGLTYSLFFTRKPEEGYNHATAELRPFTEATYEIPLGKIFFTQRLRLDNRFIQANENENIFEESNYVMRFRYRVQLKVPVKNNDEGITTISLRLADEIMLNHQYSTFDQNRIYVTGEFRLDKHFSLEAGYIYIYQHALTNDEVFQRNVFRFSVLHKIE